LKHGEHRVDESPTELRAQHPREQGLKPPASAETLTGILGFERNIHKNKD
jgi:hypothetical protein